MTMCMTVPWKEQLNLLTWLKKNAAMETARAAKTGIDKVNEELEYLQKRLMKYLNIRFFSGLFVRQAKTPRVPAI